MYKNIYIKLKQAYMAVESWDYLKADTDEVHYAGEFIIELESVTCDGCNPPFSCSSQGFVLGAPKYEGKTYLICTEGDYTAEKVDGNTILGAMVLQPCEEQPTPGDVLFESLTDSALADAVFDFWYERNHFKLDSQFHRVRGICVDEVAFEDLDIDDDYFENNGREYVATV